jgi:hypothetical protein
MRYFNFVLIVFILTGCATLNKTPNSKVIVEVDSYGNDSYLESKKFIIASGDSTISESDLQFQEFSDYVKKILVNKKDYVEVDDWDEADLMIFFKFGISDPETFKQTYAVPTWGQTGVSSTTTRGNVHVNPYGNNITYNETTSSTPTYGVTGSRIVTKTYTIFFRYVTLTAYDLNEYKKKGKEKIIWNTILTSSGNSNDLRKVIPYMIVIGSSYFGKSSGEKKLHEILEGDDRVNHIKGF